MKGNLVKLYFRDIKRLWYNYRLIYFLKKSQSIEISYHVGRFLKINRFRHTVRVQGRIKEYFDGFDDDFWHNKKVMFNKHQSDFIAYLFLNNLDDFEIV